MSIINLFFIKSLAAAGMQPALEPAHAKFITHDPLSAETWAFKADRDFTLIGHRSHSSHRSHRSHSSHSSHRSSYGGGGGSYSTTPTYRPPPVQNYNYGETRRGSGPGTRQQDAIMPQNLTASPNIGRIKGNQIAFRTLVMRVQAALFAVGLYTGTIDGIAGPATSTAISLYEKKHNMPVTGRLSDNLLDSLNIDTSGIR